MHHDSLEFHNVAELPNAAGGGRHLARFPSQVWPATEAPAGPAIIRSSNGSEIRFVTDKPCARIFLRALTEPADIVHLSGNQILKYETLEPGKIHGLELSLPLLEANRTTQCRRAGGFSPEVYRIYSAGATLAYHGMDTMGGHVRPPNTSELPKRRWLAYGSSITQSGKSFHSYVNTAAQLLEADACNLGMGGSCWIEPTICDFIAHRDDWDFATFELGVNMLQPHSNNKLFEQRVDHLLQSATASYPHNPIFLLTIFGNGTYHEREKSPWQEDLLQKNEILRQVASKFPGQVHLIEGTDIATDLRGFNVDLLHPEPLAHVRMGLKLAEFIEPVLSKHNI